MTTHRAARHRAISRRHRAGWGRCLPSRHDVRLPRERQAGVDRLRDDRPRHRRRRAGRGRGAGHRLRAERPRRRASTSSSSLLRPRSSRCTTSFATCTPAPDCSRSSTPASTSPTPSRRCSTTSARTCRRPARPPLAGNSVGTDRMFLARDMPTLESLPPLPDRRRVVDQGACPPLVSRGRTSRVPAKNGNHRALADIQESIEELRYYRAAVFVPPPGPDSEPRADHRRRARRIARRLRRRLGTSALLRRASAATLL